jgi:iron complex outermembrane recepter protein
MTKANTHLFKTLLLLGTALAGANLSLATPIMAQPTSQKSVDITIASGNLTKVLREFALKTGRDVIFSGDLVAGKSSRGVSDAKSEDSALSALLEGTGLSFKATASGGYAIVEGPKSQPDEVVVIGTRLAKEYAGAAPVQVIDQEKAAQGGLLETAEILRAQPQVSGPRSQLRYGDGQSFGGDLGGEGPGTQTIALRGLSPSQTLVLVNGRRVPAAGIEGVPRSADLSLIPSGLVKDINILTDGASPVYGTEAIAGVVDIRLRQNIDATELYTVLSQPEAGGGTIGLISLVTGKTFDRGFVGLGVEYRESKGLRLSRARKSGPNCPAFYERRADGSFSENNLFAAQLPGTEPSPCLLSFNTLSGVFGLPGGDLYYATPGRTNIGVPGFSIPDVRAENVETADPSFGFKRFDSNANGRIDPYTFDPVTFETSGDDGFPDPDGDGKLGFDPRAAIYSTWRHARAGKTHMISPLKQVNVFTYGNYDTNRLGNATAYFEASFNERRTETLVLGNPIFGRGLTLGISNPTNPCGLEKGPCYSGSSNDLVTAEVRPYIKIDGDADFVKSQIRQYRFVGGLRGDLSALNGLGGEALGFSDWRYDVSINAGRSEGTSNRPAILKDRLSLSLQTTVRDPITNQLVCGADDNADGLPDDPASCVPVNLFTEDAMINHRLTDREMTYLLGEFAYRTQVDLVQISAAISGEAINLPAGKMSWALGAEFRYDAIDASANEDGRKQNFASISAFVDPGAKGNRSIKEAYAEVGIPIIRDKPFIHSLNLSLAGRITNEEFSGTNSTYSVRTRYEPVSWLAFRGTYGSSFRSPSAYELFVEPFSITFPVGFADPCAVPFEALGPGGVYDPSGETRSTFILDRCRANSVNPLTLNLNDDYPEASLERGSALDDLKPERSKAITLGAVITLDDRVLPSNKAFADLKINFAASYYKIKLKDEIQIGDLFSVLQGCYSDATATRYCSRIKRGSNGFITNLREGFINGDSRQSKGVDFNVLASKGFRIGKRNYTLNLDLAGNYEYSVFSSFGGGTEFAGTLGFPKLKANLTAQLRQGPWVGTWFTNYVGKSEYFRDFRFEPGNYASCPPLTNTTCTPVQDAEGYTLHNMSITYAMPSWQISFGVNNVFDKAPPRLTGVVNTPTPLNTLQNGNYDLYGRSFTVQVRRSF